MPGVSRSFCLLLLGLLGTLGIFQIGCKRSAPAREEGYKGSQPPADTGSGSAVVSYKSNVHVLDGAPGRAAIQGVSSNGAALLLDSSNPQIQSLKAGDVLVIKGLLAKKIVAAESQGASVLVLTQQASLGDAIDHGHIRVSAPVRFGALRSANGPFSLPRKWNLLPAVAYAAGPEESESAGGKIIEGVKGAIIDDWDVDWSATPADKRLNLDLKMKKSVGGFTALITGEGYLDNFDFNSDIGVEQSTTDQIETSLKNLNGVMNFKWEVAKDTPGVQTGDDRIKLPAGIEIPLAEYLEGFPLFLEISSALIVKPAISGGKEYSRGAFRITYDGYQHFTAKKGNIDADGNVTGDIQFLESQNISALAPMGMVVAFAAPRIELTFGISKILDFKDMKEAAAKVDALADLLAQKSLTPDQYQQFKSSPMGQFGMTKAIQTAIKSDAAAYFEMVSSAGMSFTGASAIVPCSRHDIHLWGKVGASAEAFGQDVGEVEKDVFKKDFTRIDPPGTRLCEEVNPG
jgi:hypothetical protein